MRTLLAGLTLAAMLATVAANASAATYSGLRNTGVDAAGVSQASGAAEAHWCVYIGSSASCDTPYVYADTSGYPIPPWLSGPAGGVSGWITPFRDTNGVQNEIYTYRYQFTGVAGALTARDAHDDVLLDIELYDVTNSTSLGTFGDPGPVHSFGSWSTPLTMASNLNAADTYYVQYRVQNSGGGPTGLRVEFVPEPATLALVSLALGGLIMRRCQPRA